MLLTLQRRPQQQRSTPGTLAVNAIFECFTLELPVRDGAPGSAIPSGKYEIVTAPSPKFQQKAATDAWVRLFADAMPHIVCPPRTLIMIHWGNTPDETDGCVLVGQDRAADYVGNSRAAFAALYAKITQALKTEGCQIEIVDCQNDAVQVRDAVTGEN